MSDSLRWSWGQEERDRKARWLRSDRRFLRRALELASCDGIPDTGSSEIRLHGPLEGDRYGTTDKVMVSFRIGSALSQPVALLESLSCDDENTHITGRSAIAVNLRTGHALDQGLFFQRRPGDYSSVLAAGEIEFDRIRKQIRREQDAAREDGDRKAHGTCIETLKQKQSRILSVLHRFQEAAGVLGVSVSPTALQQNRRLFKIAQKSQIVPLPMAPCGLIATPL